MLTQQSTYEPKNCRVCGCVIPFTAHGNYGVRVFCSRKCNNQWSVMRNRAVRESCPIPRGKNGGYTRDEVQMKPETKARLAAKLADILAPSAVWDDVPSMPVRISTNYKHRGI